FVERGIAIEVTHRSTRRLYGLKPLAPLREDALPPRGARLAGGSRRGGRHVRPTRCPTRKTPAAAMRLHRCAGGWRCRRSSGKNSN
ncbi:MAG TPA: hypothetical protein VNF04_00445, partial [Stellaceae bacterium]|nr:hypothetical protein [Stellaceae bacterium]